MITKITYKRIKNLGNYQSETLEAEAVVNELENPEQVMKELREFVMNSLYPQDHIETAKKDSDGDTFF
jgi:hypothetical protein